MNKYASFIAGLAVGIAAGYFLNKVIKKKDSTEEIEEPVLEQDSNEDEEVSGYSWTKEADKMKEAAMEDALKRYSNYDPEGVLDATDLEEPMESVDEETDYEDDYEDDYSDYYVDEEIPNEGPSDVPYSISPSEYANTNLYFDKDELYYYAVDDVLVDDNENPIDDINGLVGDGFKVAIGEYEDNVAYIRNESISTDYCIISLNKQFFDEGE